MEFRELNENEFNNFNHPLKTFYQDVKMDLWSKKNNYISYYAGVYEDKNLIAATRLIARKNRLNKYHFYAPRGLLLDYNNEDLLAFFTIKLKKFIKQKKGYILHIDPLIIYKERDIDGNIKEGINNEKLVQTLKKLGYIHQGFTKGYDLKSQGRWHFTLDTELSYEQISKNYRESTRRKIKKALKSGVEIFELSKEEIKTFKKITSETSERKSFHDKSLIYYQTMKESFKDDAKFLIARLNVQKYIDNLNLEIKTEESNLNKKNADILKINERINTLNTKLKEIDQNKKYIDLSVAMFMTYNSEVSYLFGGSYKQYMHLYSQYLMQDYMIKFAIEHNYHRYDFYGISGIFNKDDISYGVYDFKKSFGGVVEEYIGDFDLKISSYYYIHKLLHK